MKFTDDFEKREFLAREALKELNIKYPKLFKNELFFTNDKYSSYDSFYFLTDDSGSIKKRVKIELKIRDKDFDEFLLEKKKLKSIRKDCRTYLNDDEYSILYINFTPTQTILWDITDINEDNTSKLLANKATSVNRIDKENKDVIMLSPDDGIKLRYILNERELIDNYKKRKNKVLTKSQKILKGINWWGRLLF